MANLSLLSKYICETYSIEMFKGCAHLGAVRVQQAELCGSSIIFVMYGNHIWYI